MKLETNKQTIFIEDKQVLEKYVIAMLLGDGCLDATPGKYQARKTDQKRTGRVRNARYMQCQLAKHSDFIFWKSDILQNIAEINMYETDAGTFELDGKTYNRNPQIRMHTRSHTFFTGIYSRMYSTGRKSISEYELRHFDWESLAIWFMDDGYSVAPSPEYHRFILCTDNFSYDECLLLKDMLSSRLGLDWTTNKRTSRGKVCHRLALSSKDRPKFLHHITPLIKPSFMYKLRTSDPVLA